MTTLEKVLYTAKAHTTGGRDGASKTSDGRLDVTLSSPGTAGTGTNPEQLFAAGYSACFIGAMKAVAGKMKATLPADLSIDAEVDLGPIPDRPDAHSYVLCQQLKSFDWRARGAGPHPIGRLHDSQQEEVMAIVGQILGLVV